MFTMFTMFTFQELEKTFPISVEQSVLVVDSPPLVLNLAFPTILGIIIVTIVIIFCVDFDDDHDGYDGFNASFESDLDAW